MADRDPNESPFQTKMRRMQQALDDLQRRQREWSRNAEQWGRWAERHAEQWERLAEHHANRLRDRAAWRARKRAWKEERRRAKQLRREQGRAATDGPASKAQAFVFAVMAAVALFFALGNPGNLWWLIFVALGFGQSAARIYGNARARERAGLGQDEDQDEQDREDERDARRDEEKDRGERKDERKEKQKAAPPSPPSPTSEADAKVDALCDKLLAEVRSGPNLLREVVRNPEQTVEALRKSCHELSRRERELRGLTTPEDEQRLASERAALAARVDAEPDAVTKDRLKGALDALDAQRRQRAELSTAAARVSAEHLRLYYTLENLYAQVLRVRSADAASAEVAGAGLRKSLEQLGEEMDAVAEALESVHREEPRLEPLSDIGGDTGGRTPGGRERV